MTSRLIKHIRFLALRVLLTEQCNLRCVFCHNEGQQTTSRYLDITLREFRVLVEAALARGLGQIKLSGGEPTLHPDILAFLKAALQYHLDVVVVTNGTNSRVLAAAAELGARISINLPTTDHDKYKQLTGGSLEKVGSLIDCLQASRAPVALNSYATSQASPRAMREILSYASDTGCAVKFLIPCQLPTESQQRRVFERYSEALVQLGCTLLDSTPYDSTWVSATGISTRLVLPWCPSVCKAVDPGYRSLRLAADRTLRPCFGGAGTAVSICLARVTEAGRDLDKALALTGRRCGGGPGVPLVRRRASSRERTYG